MKYLPGKFKVIYKCSINIKEKLKNTRAEYLCLNLGERLVHIPWELLHNGDQFLCQRFAMGRIVKTRQSLLGNWSRELGRPLNVLLLADPTGDLKGAYAEGIQIRRSSETSCASDKTTRAAEISRRVSTAPWEGFDARLNSGIPLFAID